MTSNSRTVEAFVFEKELEEIAARRKEVQTPERFATDPVGDRLRDLPRLDLEPSTSLNLVGLAISGGGIRSAAFALGVVEQLANQGLLEEVDYMSTVSGGGYLGSSISSLMASPASQADRSDGEEPSTDYPIRAGQESFPFRHVKGVQESEAFKHLRNHANYLMTGGWTDRIAAAVTMLRGWVIHAITMLAPVCLGAILLAGCFYGWSGSSFGPVRGGALATPWAILGCVSVLAAAGILRRNVRFRRVIDVTSVSLLGLLLLVPLLELQLHFLYSIERAGLSRIGKDFAIGLTGTGVPFLFALRASRKVSHLRNRILLYAIGIMAPLMFWFGSALIASWIIEGRIAFEDGEAVAGSPAHFASRCLLVLFAGYFAFLLSLMVDMNLNSLHSFYRRRLSRAFLFYVGADGQLVQHFRRGMHATRPDRLRLSELNPVGSAAPYHLINTTLNIQRTEDPTIRRRSADFFLLSKWFVGSQSTGYCETAGLERMDPELNLGTAMAISGAAAAPSMGNATIRPLTFILAMLNLRLGYWLPNPAFCDRWKTATAPWRKFFGRGLFSRIGPLYFVSELFGRLGVTQPRINLSDGGHIENLGIYELLRRRCRFIIAIDGEADPDLRFPSLTQVMRYARLDLAVDIQIDLRNIRRNEEGHSSSNCALGVIKYRSSSGDQETGLLLYIKAATLGSESETVRGYQAGHPEFPHESTANQFFTEDQFEAYRDLGWSIVRELREKGWNEELDDPGSTPIADFFHSVELPLGSRLLQEDSFLQLSSELANIEREFDDPRVAGYSCEIYPELAQVSGAPKIAFFEDFESLRRVFHLCQQQFRLMESVFIQLRMDLHRNRSHPVNRGWLNLFRRWAQSPTFQRNWAISMGTFGAEFQQFCDRMLGLSGSFLWVPSPGGSRRCQWNATIEVPNLDGKETLLNIGCAEFNDDGLEFLGDEQRRTLTLKMLEINDVYDTHGLLDRIMHSLRTALDNYYSEDSLVLRAVPQEGAPHTDPLRHPFTLRRCGFVVPMRRFYGETESQPYV